jgi:hypothetical protein
MSRLILTFEDSAAGALKAAGLADRVVGFQRRFVWGMLPSQSELKTEAHVDGFDLTGFCERFDTIELWADPEPNAQLQLIWLLDYLRPHPNVVARLTLVQTNNRISNLESEEWGRRRPRAVPVHTDHLEIASAAWSAWRAPAPVTWFGLLAQD